MAIIKTLGGFEIEVDEDIYKSAKGVSWSVDKDGYAYKRVRLEGGRIKNVYLHRLITNAEEGSIVDHRDGNTFNCKRLNLRFATTYQSACNKRRANGGTSEYKGVYFSTQTTKGKEYSYWWAKVKKHGKVVFKKAFKTELEAAWAYDAAAREHHGEYARLNFPDL